MARHSAADTDEDREDAVRLDKWLWAARFFRSRSLAREAIESGQVRYQGERSKVGRTLTPGATLQIRQGRDEIEVTVLALSTVRGGAPQARMLYQETERSRQLREQRALQRQLANDLISPERPDKQQRRALQRLKRDG
jgi:ribosome-associated heat shock protein Hsp15